MKLDAKKLGARIVICFELFYRITLLKISTVCLSTLFHNIYFPINQTVKIMPFIKHTYSGINEVNKDIIIFAFLRSPFALNKQKSDTITNKKVDNVPVNNTLLFTSPVSLAHSSILNTTIKPTRANDIEVINQLANLLIHLTSLPNFVMYPASLIIHLFLV